uniref:ribonuclease H n=1 Tax=Nothobranchius furzeri TaxID=105023 RepID=A0A8C6MCT3_NOTFU
MEQIGYKNVILADGSVRNMAVHKDEQGILYIKGAENLISLKDLVKITKDPALHVSFLGELDMDSLIKEQLEKTSLDPHKLREIIQKGNWATHKNDCGRVKEQCIIKGAMPAREKQYPIREGRDEIRCTLAELKEKGIIEEKDTLSTCLPIQAVPKPDGTYRLVHNLKGLNRVTPHDVRKTFDPYMQLRTMPIKKYKTCIDLANGFWSVPLAQESRAKTGFTFEGKHYEWCVLPMGWVNAANKFQGVVQSYLEGLPVVQYIDDIFFTHDCESEHLKTLDEVVTRLTCAGFKLNLKKSQLGRTKVTFLGFEVSDSVAVPFTYLQNITPPHDLLTLEGVIGQLQYISSNVRDFRNIIDPIMSLKKGLRTKVGQKLVTHNRKLSSQELETYQAVMVKIGANLVNLSNREHHEPLAVRVIVGQDFTECLFQNYDSKSLITCKGYKLAPTETRYTPSEKVLTTLMKHKDMMFALAGSQKIIIQSTDYMIKELRKDLLPQARAVLPRWAKWEMLLANPQIHVEGETKLKPDRKEVVKAIKPEAVYYTDGSKKTADADFCKWGFVRLLKDRKYQQAGQTVGSAQTAELTAVVMALADACKLKLRSVRLVTDSKYVKDGLDDHLAFWEAKDFQKTDGERLEHADLWTLVSCYKKKLQIQVTHVNSHTNGKSEDEIGNAEVDELVQARALFLPTAFLQNRSAAADEELVTFAHKNYGHVGVLRLREIFKKENISVPKLKELTARVKATCESCKVKGGAQPVIYDHLPIMCDVPGVHFSTDVGECASRGVNGHKFFLVIKDNGPGDQSKIIPLKRVTGNTVSMALSLHLPLTCESLRSDGGPEFKNDKVSCLLESRGIRHIFSIPYESHTNGIAERAVRTIKNHILTNLSSRWDTPEGVSELNVILNMTKLKRTEKKTNPEHVSVLQKGERIWVKRGPVRKGDCIKHNVSGPFIIKDVTGNVVLTDTGLRVHPHQVIK